MPKREPKLRVATLVDDEHLLILDKPAGVALLPDDTDQPCALDLLDAPQPTDTLQPLFHMEPDVSGLVIYTKTEAAHADVTQQFTEENAERVYLALVNGYVADDGVTRHPLWRDNRRGRTRVSAKRGRPAVTEYKVAERIPGQTLLEVRPRTDHPEQIRAHLAAIGHPLTIDPIYGGAETVYLSTFKADYRPNSRKPERPLIARLTLHALRVVMLHPATGALLALDAPLTKDFRAAINQLSRLG